MPRPPIISRDTLVDCQPWEPADFRRPPAPVVEVVPEPIEVAPPEDAHPHISEEEWQAALDEELANARDEGRRDGFAQGFQDGFEQGRRQGEEDARQIATLMQSVRDAVGQMNGAIAEELVDLSLQLAQQFLRGALHVQPERILPLVREVLGDGPTAPAPAMLRVHQDDAELSARCSVPNWLPPAGRWWSMPPSSAAAAACRRALAKPMRRCRRAGPN